LLESAALLFLKVLAVEEEEGTGKGQYHTFVWLCV
jgi:hypothetical protein